MFKMWFGRKQNTKDCPHRPPECEHLRTLDCLQLDEEGEIDSIPDQALLEPLGFRPGKKVCLRCRARFGGPLVAEIEGRHTALGRSLAKQIKLRKQLDLCPENE